MATSDNFAINTSLPFYPAGNVSGAILTLSQNPCNDPYKRNVCCVATHKSKALEASEAGYAGYTCANWTGAPPLPAGSTAPWHAACARRALAAAVAAGGACGALF